MGERERDLADGPGASLGGGRVEYYTESAEEISTFEQKIAEKGIFGDFDDQ